LKIFIKYFLVLFIISVPSQAQDLWSFEKNSQHLDHKSDEYIQTVTLNKNKLFTTASSKSKETISFPNEFGQTEQFTVEEIEVLSLSLSKAYPNIKTYVGQSLERANVYARWSSSPMGINAMLTSANGRFFIQPKRNGNQNEHLFYKRGGSLYDDFERLNCLVDSKLFSKQSEAQIKILKGANSKAVSTQNLKTYRIAVSATAEFTQFFGDDDDSNGTNKEDAFVQVVSTINRINEVFGIDFGVRLELVSSANLLYDDPETDPYGDDFNEEIQEVLTDSFGESNYDIGHLFDYGDANGNAGSVGNVCSNGRKGSAFTSHPFVDTSGVGQFLNDYFDIDFVAHEIGHQFGAYHTFSHETEGSGVNSEPGSGSTIMGYAGITGLDDLQNHSDPYFHYNSIVNVAAYLARFSCQSTSDIDNQTPTVDAGLDVVIPIGTAYTLEAVATDPDEDALTYCWEQLNSGLATQANFGPTSESGSNNRSFLPTNTPVRTVPSMSRVLAGKLTQTNPQNPEDWQTVSLVNRSLSWGITVRDRTETNSVSTGQTAQDFRTISVIEDAGPFEITSQNTNTVVWKTGANEFISWNVNNTDQAPINTETVSIYLSLDGGENFDTLLVSNTLNDGQYDFVVPVSFSATNTRIKIVPDNGIYFAINSQSFVIAERAFATPFQIVSKKICDPTALSYNFTLNYYQDFTGTVTYSLQGVPSGINHLINPNSSSTSQEQGTISLSNLSTLDPGSYSITLVASSGDLVERQDFRFISKQSNFETPIGLHPDSSDALQPLKPLMNWEADENADQYILQLSTSSTFESLVISSTIATNNFSPFFNLEGETTYFWRVKGFNVCGESSFSETQNFKTDLVDCSPIGAASLPVSLQDAVASQIGITYAEVYMANDYKISDLNVEFSIEHTWLSDMVLTLISPDGTEVILASNIGGSGSNFENTIFDQEATNLTEDSSAPFTGSFRPEGDLSVFVGTSSFGKWRLKIEDIGPLDSGRIVLFNLNFCVNGIIMKNDDFDLLSNENDNCPLVSNQDQLDSDGNGQGDLCDIETFNNFTISKLDETCVSRNNGAIQISAVAIADYTVQIIGPNGFNDDYIFSAYDLSIPNLESGTYLVCIGISDDPSYERCYTASISQPDPLQVTSLVNENDLILSLNLQGASNYTVTLNNKKSRIQSKSQVDLPLRLGLNTIEVFTDLSCQGSFKKEIYIAADSVLYPNPVNENAYVLVGGTETNIRYIIYDIRANLLFEDSIQLEANDRKIPINMSSLANGNYFLKILSDQKEETIKFIKK